MRFRQVLVFIFVGVALCMSSSVYGETIFSDDIEGGTLGDLMPSTPSVGTWVIDGIPGYSIVTNFITPAGGDKFAATLRGPAPDNIWDSMNATFTEQTVATDVVRLEADMYGNTGTPHVSLYSSSGDYVAYLLFYGDTHQVLGPGGFTDLTWDANEWNHFAIEYSPGANFFDLYLDAQPKATIPVYGGGTGIGANIAQIKFASVNNINWTCVDNVLVTVTSVPEPSALILMACGLFGLLTYGRRQR